MAARMQVDADRLEEILRQADFLPLPHVDAQRLAPFPDDVILAAPTPVEVVPALRLGAANDAAECGGSGSGSGSGNGNRDGNGDGNGKGDKDDEEGISGWHKKERSDDDEHAAKRKKKGKERGGVNRGRNVDRKGKGKESDSDDEQDIDHGSDSKKSRDGNSIKKNGRPEVVRRRKQWIDSWHALAAEDDGTETSVLSIAQFTANAIQQQQTPSSPESRSQSRRRFVEMNRPVSVRAAGNSTAIVVAPSQANHRGSNMALNLLLCLLAALIIGILFRRGSW